MKNFKKLLAQAERWRQTELLRGYIEAVEERTLEEKSMTKEIENWIQWAKKKADWYDPMVEAGDELLTGVDRNGLS